MWGKEKMKNGREGEINETVKKKKKENMEKKAEEGIL